jgi:hypothetical protein
MEVTITLLGAQLRGRHERSNLMSIFIADLPCAANQYHKPLCDSSQLAVVAVFWGFRRN